MKFTFNFLEKWDFTKELSNDSRNKKVRLEYNKFKETLKIKNIKIDDYIMDNFLKDKLYNIVENNYPYNIEKNMLHYVLWVHQKYKITNKKMCNIIIDKMNELGYNEYFCFENHKNAKSVLGITHYQIFFRKC